jgi:hypothetical protein
LRNARRVKQPASAFAPGLSEFGACIAAFSDLVAVMRATGDFIDGDVLQALIIRVAELLGESVPPGL